MSGSGGFEAELEAGSKGGADNLDLFIGGEVVYGAHDAGDFGADGIQALL